MKIQEIRKRFNTYRGGDRVLTAMLIDKLEEMDKRTEAIEKFILNRYCYDTRAAAARIKY